MAYDIALQNACRSDLPVSDTQIMAWVKAALEEEKEQAEVTLRFVTEEEITELNSTYRKKDKPTNVLAFPANLPAAVALECPFIGDIVICPHVLDEESQEQHKPLDMHWAHIVIHGVLHLLGYDHIKDEDAEHMQAQEIKLLTQFGYPNPYYLPIEEES